MRHVTYQIARHETDDESRPTRMLSYKYNRI